MISVSNSPKIISQHSYINFDVLGSHFDPTFEEAPGFLAGLLLSHEKASLVFQNIVATRSVVYQHTDGSLNHEHSMWYDKGPFTAEQFMQMVKFDHSISNDQWGIGLNKFKTK